MMNVAPLAFSDQIDQATSGNINLQQLWTITTTTATTTTSTTTTTTTTTTNIIIITTTNKPKQATMWLNSVRNLCQTEQFAIVHDIVDEWSEFFCLENTLGNLD